MVYDIGDPTEPLKDEWFELRNRNKRWTKDLPGRTRSKRCYAAEHVLEWQLLKTFIEADKENGPTSRCAFMEKFFLDEIKGIPRTKHKVQVAKDDGRLGKDNKFEFEERLYDFDQWTSKTQKVPRPIDWISKWSFLS